MTPRQAEAAARRIGIEPSELGYWRDEGQEIADYVSREELEIYLATGDRPLRYVEALRRSWRRIVVRTPDENVLIFCFWPRLGDTAAERLGHVFAVGPTLSDAIVALVAAIEGGE